jgi:hypothetical protein
MFYSYEKFTSTTKEKLDYIFKFMQYIEDNNNITFFDNIYGGTVQDWYNKDQLFNHFYNKFNETKNSQHFFTSLDKTNQNKLFYTHSTKYKIPDITVTEIDDILRRFYSYFDSSLLNDVKDNLWKSFNTIFNKKYYSLWSILDENGKNKLVQLFNNTCYEY